MVAESLDALVATACKPDRIPEAQTAINQLLQAFGDLQLGKENGSLSSSKQFKASALQCFKGSQTILNSSSSDPGLLSQYVSLGRTSLAAVEALSSGTTKAQLLPSRYNFIKRLVALREYETAWIETLVLLRNVNEENKAAANSADTANIAVGAVLMLLLCWIEGGDLGDDKMGQSLHAIPSMEKWLRVLPPEQANKHRDAVFKYLYKGAAMLVGRNDSGSVAVIVGAMGSVADSTAHLQRVVQTALKLGGRFSDKVAVDVAVAALTPALSECSSPDALAEDTVALLCMACQHISADHSASALHQLLMRCGNSSCPTLQQAAMLLPCVMACGSSSDSSSTQCDEAVQQGQVVMQAVQAAASSLVVLADLEELQRCQPSKVEVHARVLLAAFQCSNLVRRALAAQLQQQDAEQVVVRLGGPTGASAAVAALGLLARIVDAACVLSAAMPGSEGHECGALGQVCVLARQGHAAAVAVATAFRVGAGCSEGDVGPLREATAAVAAVLRWDFHQYCTSRGPLPARCALSQQEVSWLAATLHNVGVDLHLDGQQQAAVMPLLAAVTASMCALGQALTANCDPQDVSAIAGDVLRRCSALSDAQLKAGDGHAAALTLGHAAAALLQSGSGATPWQELVATFTRRAAEVLEGEGGQRRGGREGMTAESQAAPATPRTGRGTKAGPTRSSRGSSTAPAKRAASKPVARSSAQAEAAGTLPHLSLSALLHRTHRECVPPPARAAAAEVEVAAWAAMAGGQAQGGSAAAQCAQLCTFLAAEAFTPQQSPVEHARSLLAAYRAGVEVEGVAAGGELLSRAVHVLQTGPEATPETCTLSGVALGLLTLDSARQLVEQATLDQRQQRQQSHAAASTSGPGPAAPGASEAASLPEHLSLEEWREVGERAEEALARMEQGLGAGGVGAWRQCAAQPETVVGLAAELGYMAAMQGRGDLEARWQRLCTHALGLAHPSPGSGLAHWAALTPASHWLHHCLHPSVGPALATHIPTLAAHAKASYPWSEYGLDGLPRGAEAAQEDVEAGLRALSTRYRTPLLTLQRAHLHRLLAEQQAGSGSCVSALFHAMEAHRLVLAAGRSGAEEGPSGGLGSLVGEGGAQPGWWRLSAEQLSTLLQLGRLFELSGMPEEALHALKEGLRMAASMGCASLAAAFRTQIAVIFCQQGATEAASAALLLVGALLEAAASMPPAGSYSEPLLPLLSAHHTLALARLSMARCDYGTARMHCQAAEAACTKAKAGCLAVPHSLAGGLEAARGWALVLQAQCSAGQEDVSAAAQLASQALEVLGCAVGGAAYPSSSCAAPSTGSTASLCLQPQAYALLLLAQLEGATSSGGGAPGKGGVCLWGLAPSGAPHAGEVVQAVAAAGPKAGPRRAAGRGTRSKGSAKGTAAAAGSSGSNRGGSGGSRAGSEAEPVQQQLWHAYWLTREVPHINRMVCSLLSRECAQRGCAHLAALLLHASLGSTMRQQYRLVLHTKLQQLQQQELRAGGGGGAAAAAEAAVGGDEFKSASSSGCGVNMQQREALEEVLSLLEDPLDGDLVRQLAGVGDDVAPPSAPPPPQPRRGSKQQAQQQQEQQEAVQRQHCGALAPAAALAQLDQAAAAALQQWTDALPQGTVICSISCDTAALPLKDSGAAGLWQGADQLVLSRLAPGQPPVIVQLSAAGGGEALSQHPVRALSMDQDTTPPPSSRLHPLAEEMLRLLEDSGRSMQDMGTETKAQQREWWTARLGLDDRLASLLDTLDHSWLGQWRCLLWGAEAEPQQHSKGTTAAAAAERLCTALQGLASAASAPALSAQQLATIKAVLSSLLQGRSSGGGSELADACTQLCASLGLTPGPEHLEAVLQQALGCEGGSVGADAPGAGRGGEGGDSNCTSPQLQTGAAPQVQPTPRRLGRCRGEAASSGQQPKGGEVGEVDFCRSSSAVAAEGRAGTARSRRAGGTKAVSFKVEVADSEGEAGDGDEATRARRQQTPALRQRPSSSRRGSVKMAVAEQPEDDGSESPAGLSSGAAGGRGKRRQPGDLSEAFDALTLEQPEGEGPRRKAVTTARGSKTRSRLKMMQATTPGPATAMKGVPEADLTTAKKAVREAGGTMGRRGVATAPRQRAPSRISGGGGLRGSSHPTASGPVGGTAGDDVARGPVLLVLDPALQVLPWESVPGLHSQSMYRIPSLPCAAASAHRSLRHLDPSSTFYSLNPSGDLAETQGAFQDWFTRLRWEGKSGEAPTSAELAAALQSHQLFVYFGHGGGEQYIPAGRLRTLDSCSAALLMGCSSGRLRLQSLYDPVGPVLAYLLAGCPAAVANLWDVTDKDIDRFSQALLRTWLGDKEGAERGAGGVRTPRKMDISSAVAGSRGACKLRHLIGAAPVCYGVPSTVGSPCQEEGGT